ncbi:DUF4177 domain-containing protein [Salipiger sp. H15]|uniref:DUF4177 domain-containing protein n=1 Tax=Alloyangia sp. H15 TaxID=3029062 RepID=A0AAU8ADN8_9RHOB
MKTHEYKVIPAPTKGEKAKAAKGPEGRFAVSMSRLLNDMAEQGWEYIRADTLPSEERSGLTSSTTVWRTLLVFRRPVPQAVQLPQTGPLPEVDVDAEDVAAPPPLVATPEPVLEPPFRHASSVRPVEPPLSTAPRIVPAPAVRDEDEPR